MISAPMKRRSTKAAWGGVVMIDDQFVRFGSDRYAIAGLVDVRLQNAGTEIAIWPIAFAALLAAAGLGLFWKSDDAAGWIIGMGTLLAATALCLSCRTFTYRLTITAADGQDRSAVSSDGWEMERLKELIERRIMSGSRNAGAKRVVA